MPFKTRRNIASFGLACICWSFPAAADQPVNELGLLIDSQFRNFAQNLSAAQSHRALARRGNDEISPLEYGFELDTADLDRHAYLESLTTEQSAQVLYIPRFRISTAYSDGWNAGAFYSSVPETDIRIYGGELRYSLHAQSESLLPSVSVRGTYSQLRGLSDMFVTSTGVELSVSKGFSYVTPYAGIGTTWLDGEYYLDGYTSRLTRNKYFMGLQFDLGMFNLSAQTEQTGESSTTKATMGIRF